MGGKREKGDQRARESRFQVPRKKEASKKEEEILGRE